jgi:GTPase SAR1 family protein
MEILLHMYADNPRAPVQTSTPNGVAFHLKNISFGGVEVTLQIWEFRAQERFRFLIPTQFSGCKGFIMFFDLTRMATTLTLENTWLSAARKEDPYSPGFLLGTNMDKVDQDFPAIEPNFGKDFIINHRMQGYFETSSKGYDILNQAFRDLTKAIFDHNKIPYDPNLA